MQVAKLLFELASRDATGTVLVSVGDPVAQTSRLEVNRGWVHGVSLSPRPPRGEDALRAVLKRTPAKARFLDGDPPLGTGRYTPFHPAVILRNHVESSLAPDAGELLRERAAGQPLRLVFAPHASCLGRDERPLVTLLAQPRGIDDLDATRLTAPARVDRLLAFLYAVGCITLDSDGPTAWQLLELPEGAPQDEVRRAYKRIARELHPDLHPGISDGERRRLEREFAAVTAAYRRLLPAG